MGSSYGLNNCSPNSIQCPGFNSTTASYGTYTNQTWTLAQGAGCNITVDASQALARVIFDETSFLGIDYEEAKIGQVITIPSGKVATIPIYNAAQTGPLTFLISYSGSVATLVSTVVTLLGGLLIFS